MDNSLDCAMNEWGRYQNVAHFLARALLLPFNVWYLTFLQNGRELTITDSGADGGGVLIQNIIKREL